jgi:hypothetical protein
MQGGGAAWNLSPAEGLQYRVCAACMIFASESRLSGFVSEHSVC